MAKESHETPPKRTDVGYKRPPIETRFKKGQKRPPRKPKQAPPLDAKELLRDILQEQRRVEINGKARWLTNAELIARRALVEADKGSSVLMRLLDELMLGPPTGADDDLVPEFVFERG